MKYIFTILLVLFSVQLTTAQNEDGPYKDYYKSGELEIEGQYKNGKREGKWKRYHKNGQVSRLYSYEKGKLNSEETSYYETGIVSNKTERVGGNYVNIGYYETGKLRYERLVESGYYKSYYESGAIKIETNYLENEIVGPWKKYYENGQLEWLVNYEEGYRQREYKHYYDNGDLKLEGYNFKDKLYGEEKRYLPNNVLEWKGKYENGFLVKTWVKYDSNGDKIKKIKFKNGVATKDQFADVLTPTKVAEGVLERVPIYPGCEVFLNNTKRKKCMSLSVAKFVNKNFNTDLGSAFNIKGRQKIHVFFKINKEGDVFNIRAKASHPALRREAIRVIKSLPKFKPGMQRNKPVIVPFAIPIVFQVQ